MMNLPLLKNEFVQALGWTLIHSLWQSLLLLLLLTVFLRFISRKNSSLRYTFSLAALFSQIVVSIWTFIYLWPETTSAVAEVVTLQATDFKPTYYQETFVNSLLNLLYSNMDVVLLGYLIGVFIFTIRLIGAGVYVRTLRSTSTPIAEVYDQLVLELSYKLGIKHFVEIGESSKIDIPIVIGYLRPIILLPIGMTAGMSIQQVETILLHELAHIRRNDYLINLIQSSIEVMFFFNPFIWIVSGQIRTERENCCDDLVVRYNNNVVDYVTALSRLEETRLEETRIASSSPLAMQLAHKNNQLLKRIKRIMEKSITHYPFRERLIPLTLLIIGFVCASWMTLKPEEEITPEAFTPLEVTSDTSKHEAKTADQSKAEITVRKDKTENQDTDEFEDLDEFEYEFQYPMDIDINEDFAYEFNFDTTVDDAFQFEIHDIQIPDMNFESFQFQFDSLAPLYGSEEFSEEFKKMFSERFESFYKKHQEELETMMNELNEKMRNNQGLQALQDEKFQKDMQRISEDQRRMAVDQRHRAMEMQKMHMQRQEEQMRRMEERMHRMREQQEIRMKVMEARMHRMEERRKAFEAELKDQLIKDGYLKKNEELKTLNLDDQGNVTVNGKSIKEKDKEKYKAIHDKYHKRPAKISIEEGQED